MLILGGLPKTASLVWFTLLRFPRFAAGGELVPHQNERRASLLQAHPGPSPSIEATSQMGATTGMVQFQQDSNCPHKALAHLLT